jgi:hypothetical protein
MEVKELRCEGIDWGFLVQDMAQFWAVVNTLINQWVLQNAGSFFSSLGTVSLPRRTLYLWSYVRLRLSIGHFLLGI